MRIKKYLLVFTAFLFFTFPVFSKQKSTRISLDTGWTYTLFANAQAHLSIQKKSFSQLSSYCPDHKGYIWLNNSFVIPEEMKHQQLGIYLGQIKIAAEVYINGSLIGVSGWMPPQEFFNGEKPAAFTIPQSILKYDHQLNTVTIKLWTNAQGKISDNPFIDLEPKVMLYNKINNMFSSEIPFAISIFLLFISLIYVFFYLIRPVDKSNLSFALLTFFSSLYLTPICFGEYPSTYMMEYLLYQKIFNTTVPYLAMYFAVSFIRDYLEKSEEKTFKIFRSCILLSTIIAGFIPKTLWHFHIIQVIGYFISGFMFIYPIAIILEDLVNKRKKVITLLSGFSPILIVLPISLFLILETDFQFTRLVVIFGWQFTIIIFLGILLVNYVKLMTHVEFVNSNLEKIVKNKTKELQRANLILEQTNETLELEKKRTLREMELAAYVQQNFYSLRKTDFDDWEISFYFRPLESVSGDLYDLYTKEDNLKGLGIFDVSGHGISSGLVTMLVKNIIQQEFFDGYKENLCKVVNKINERVIKEKSGIENYLTGIIGRFNNNELEFVNAGHVEPVFIKNKKSIEIINKSEKTKCGVIGIGGLPTEFDSTKVTFEKDDVLILYTDGVTEAQNSENELYGKQRLLDSIELCKSKTIQEITNTIKENLFEYIGDTEIKDDITILILRRK